MQVEAYYDNCIASGACVLHAPEVFDQDEDGIVVVRDPVLTDANRAVVVEAVNACPASVLRLVE